MDNPLSDIRDINHRYIVVGGVTTENEILIRNAAAIVYCNGRDDVYRNADILTEGEKILEIGYGIRCGDAKILDGKDKFVYPGLVNTYHRFFQTFVRNLTTIGYPNMLVAERLGKIYWILQRIDSDVIYYSSLAAMAGPVKRGCITAFDHQYCFTAHTKEEAMDRQMETASRIGIRYHTGRGTNTLPRSRRSAISNDMREVIGEFIQGTKRLIHAYHDPEPSSMKQIVIAPCQPMNCHEDTFVQSVKLAEETGARLHTHLKGGENDIVGKRWGARILDRCRRISSLGKNTQFAYCWELTDEEYKVLSANGCGISHCPSSAILGGLPILEMEKPMDYGILLSLGCNGLATNDSGNLLDSICTAYMTQCYHSKEQGGGVSAYEVFRQAMVNGARTLGREGIDSLEEGKAADLFMTDAGTLELAGAVHDPCNIIGRVGLTDSVYMIMVNDRVVYENGRLANVDERGLVKEEERIYDKVLREPYETFHNLF